MFARVDLLWRAAGEAHARRLTTPRLSPRAQHRLLALARTWLDGFNACDLERLLALHAEDAVHTSPELRVQRPETSGEIRGKAALRAGWSDAMTRLPELHHAGKHLSAGEDRVVMEYERQNPGEVYRRVAETPVVGSRPVDMLP